MSTKKIEGSVPQHHAKLLRDGYISSIDLAFRIKNQNEYDVPATLVLGLAFTKEEVEDMLREAISKTNDRGAVDVLTIINIAKRRGLKP